MKTNLKTQIENLLEHGVEIKISSDRVEVTLDGSQFHNDVTVYYEEPWFTKDRDTPRKYKVQTTSWGAVEPTDIYAKAILLQALLLTNEALIASIKEAILKFNK